jgi:hypothetical protein
MQNLRNLEELVTYVEGKFSGEEYTAIATPLTDFGPVMRVRLTWIPKRNDRDVESGVIWCAPSHYTSAVPFEALK